MPENIRFENRDGVALAGVLHTPPGGGWEACAVFAHCFTCTKNVKAAVHIADALAESGIAVLRFDFTGLGQSEGAFEDTTFSSNVSDLVDAAAWMAETHGAPSVMVGHSLGGTAAMAAAAEIDSVRAVATIGSPADAEHVLHLIDSDIETIEREGEAQVTLAGRPFRVRKDFIDDVRAQHVRDGIRSLRRALLIMHSPVDELVPIDEASRIYESALHPKSFVSLDDADHLLTRPRDSRYAAQVLAAWASRYVGDNEAAAKEHAAHVPGSVNAEAALADGFLTRLNADGHRLLADEPASYGGTDLGPTPYDLLSAALGSCTAMTINFFARRESIPLQSVDVAIEHEKIHAEDCIHCDTRTGKIDRFNRRIRLHGDLDREQRDLLLKIADRCPVHKTLHAEVDIVTEEA